MAGMSKPAVNLLVLQKHLLQTHLLQKQEQRSLLK